MKKFLKWLDNFWYHYKWVTIVSAFIIAVAVIGIVQTIDKKDSDIRIVYFGPSVVSGDQANDIEFAFEQVMSRDFDGDGSRNAQLIALNYFTEEQYNERIEQAKKDDVFFAYDITKRNDTVMQLNTLIGSGETIICLLDDYIYGQLNEQGAFASLESVLGYKPEQALDDYSVRISDIDFGNYYTAFDAIDENTRLCICNISENTYFSNKKAVEKVYSYHTQMFSDIFAFSDGKEGV